MGRSGARHRLESEGEVAGGLEALRRLLFETAPDDPLGRERHVQSRIGELRRVLLEDRAHRVGGGRACERAAAGEHLVEHGAAGEDVGARVRCLPAHLLGSHVADRSQDGAGGRVVEGGRRVPQALAAGWGGELGEAEVEDLHPAVVRHEEVLGLQVAVDDALVVRRGETGRDLGAEVQRLAGRQGPAAVAAVAAGASDRFSDPSSARSWSRNLIATSRWIAVSRARQTSPMPPAPRRETIS